MSKESSQKFLGRTRAPRVQIEYDVEVNGAQKKVTLPFVMGVMAELSGQSLQAPPPVAERQFLEIDSDNFDERLKAMKPRVAASVPNTLTGEGNLGIDLVFESMEDFSPAAIARKVEPLRKLLEARGQLANLLTYMDGKTGAEDLVARLLSDPALMQSLSASPRPVQASASEAAPDA
ncbi:type VI secretion system contractile sheath small subunit [Bordetella bronchialis]|uniref:Type VI secretion system-associated protein n=1 Tax=Bordetella bronchialis TaxID=463025 RepID=A0ABM6CW79_9BORD|nr:type VI secretion system contractile sheath small subunit [Bordetella bronchialis]ANN68399.1 type VI secretion system-associated protein [Bordetella bronchialis]